MNKKRENGIIGLIVAVLLFVSTAICSFIGCSLVLTKNNLVTVSADEATSYPLSDDIFSFERGASLDKRDIQRIGFGLKLNNPAFETFSADDSRVYYFTMYRVSADGVTSTPVVQYVFCRSGEYLLTFHKNLSYYRDEVFSFSPVQTYDVYLPHTDSSYVIWKNAFSESDYILDEIFLVNSNAPDFKTVTNSTSKLLRFAVRVDDCYTNYFVRFNYEIRKFVKTERYGFLWLKERKVFDTYSGTLDSSQRSVYQVLNNMNEAGALETEFLDFPKSLSYATEILGNEELKRIQVKYLTRIGTTPFATHNYAYVDVPVNSPTIPVDRVAAALCVKDFDVLGSSCYGFEYDTATDIYTAKYLKNVWLSAKTVDGNSANYFLDCNLSYKDYYYQMVLDDVFSNDLYEYIFSQILNNFPEVKGYNYGSVYGYFGYVVIPNTYSLNALWAEMFDVNTTFQGVTVKYQYTELLKYSSYQRLLTEYQYTWLEKAWNGVAGFVTGGSWSADHYLFYAQIGVTETYIAENGADDIIDDNGLIRNEVEDGVTAIKTGVQSGLNNFKDYISDKNSRLNLFFSIVGGALIVVVVVWALVSIKNLFKGKRK